MSNLGIPDRPVEKTGDDILGIGAYARALADFLTRCDTPITLGIQGDWGAGKTSLMNMVRELLGTEFSSSDVQLRTIWFNTWMYSQFELGDQLPLLMLSSFVNSLKPPEGSKTRGLWKLATRIGPNIVAQKFTGMSVKELVADDEGLRDDVNLLEALKDDFARICGEALKGDLRNRIVFFVDDLDRLRPDKAVELLEVMKNFLDVPGLVFVLACDYNVIAQGVEAKFGVKNKQTGGRSFFDKIIQVPFQMPVHTYDLERYVGTLLKKLEWAVEDSADVASVYKPLLEHSIGFNPRSIKRLFNSILLLKLVMNQGDDAQRALLADTHMMKLLFAIVCMEMAHGDLHKFLASEVSQERLETLQTENSIAQLYQEEGPLERLEPTGTLSQFGTLFFSLVDQNRDQEISEDEIAALATVFNVSSVTSVSDAETAKPAPERRRWDLERFMERASEFWEAEDAEEALRRFHDFFTRKKTKIRFGTGREHGSITIHARLRGKNAFIQMLSIWTGGAVQFRIAALRGSGAVGKRAAEAIVDWCQENDLSLRTDQKEPMIYPGERVELLDSLAAMLDSLIM